MILLSPCSASIPPFGSEPTTAPSSVRRTHPRRWSSARQSRSRRIVQRPDEIGFSRAYASGDIDVEGDIQALFELSRELDPPRVNPGLFVDLVRAVGPSVLRRVPVPPEEIKLRGRLHSTRRDSSAIAHHYDLSNEFYQLILGASMGYSCGIFEKPADSIDQAQINKFELVCRKLDLEPGQRLLDVGAGWAGAALHAAQYHNVDAVAVTASANQAAYGRKRAAEAGLAERVDVRCGDWREIDDGPYDAIASIGMFEHVGRKHAEAYFQKMFSLLRPGGKLMLHTMCRPPFRRPLVERPQFITRYIFPDGDLLQVGDVIDRLQSVGFEANHLRELPQPLRQDAGGLARQPRDQLERSRPRDRSESCSNLAPVSCRVLAELRRRQPLHRAGAGLSEARRGQRRRLKGAMGWSAAGQPTCTAMSGRDLDLRPFRASDRRSQVGAAVRMLVLWVALAAAGHQPDPVGCTALGRCRYGFGGDDVVPHGT